MLAASKIVHCFLARLDRVRKLVVFQDLFEKRLFHLGFLSNFLGIICRRRIFGRLGSSRQQ